MISLWWNIHSHSTWFIHPSWHIIFSLLETTNTKKYWMIWSHLIMQSMTKTTVWSNRFIESLMVFLLFFWTISESMSGEHSKCQATTYYYYYFVMWYTWSTFLIIITFFDAFLQWASNIWLLLRIIRDALNFSYKVWTIKKKMKVFMFNIQRLHSSRP